MIHNNHINSYRSGVSSILFLEETVTTVFEIFRFASSSPFFDYFNEILSDLTTGGFLIYWEKSFINPRGLKMKVDEIGPQVLTMEHLMLGFQISLGALGTASVVFGLEITTNIFKKPMKNKLKNLVLQLVGVKAENSR